MVCGRVRPTRGAHRAPVRGDAWHRLPLPPWRSSLRVPQGRQHRSPTGSVRAGPVTAAGTGSSPPVRRRWGARRTRRIRGSVLVVMRPPERGGTPRSARRCRTPPRRPAPCRRRSRPAVWRRDGAAPCVRARPASASRSFGPPRGGGRRRRRTPTTQPRYRCARGRRDLGRAATPRRGGRRAVRRSSRRRRPRGGPASAGTRTTPPIRSPTRGRR